MEYQKYSLRIGALAVALAVVLRLVGVLPLAVILQRPGVLSFLTFLQTGRRIAAEVREEITPMIPTLPTPEWEYTGQRVIFSSKDMSYVNLHYNCDYRPAVEELLLKELKWDLSGPEPTILILHTHATESYSPTPGAEYEASGSYRTLDERYNMIAIGAEIARVLTEGGLTVLHDRTYHDHPSYNGSYNSARERIAWYLQQYPSIQLVLDIHRDASGNAQELVTQAVVDGAQSAQLMVVVGTDADGDSHPGWQENLSLGLKLHALLERAHPGLMRSVNLREWRFNMDLCPGSLLIEVGAAGDTQQKALTAARTLAEGILQLQYGAVGAS